MIKNNGSFCFELKSDIKEKTKMNNIKFIQTMTYGEKIVFPIFTKKVWSTERLIGKISNFIKWNSIWGENQNILSVVSNAEDWVPKFILLFENKNESINTIETIKSGRVWLTEYLKLFDFAKVYEKSIRGSINKYSAVKTASEKANNKIINLKIEFEILFK